MVLYRLLTEAAFNIGSISAALQETQERRHPLFQGKEKTGLKAWALTLRPLHAERVDFLRADFARKNGRSVRGDASACGVIHKHLLQIL